MSAMRMIENERLLIEVSDLGAELSRIYDKKNDLEVMWDANPAHWNRHSPVLFPNVGGQYKGTYLYNGVQYKSEKHGFVRNMECTCVCAEGDRIVHRLTSTEETLAFYPFVFVLEITHVLKDNDVEVHWSVKNENNKEMYFTMGGHPAIRVPASDEYKRSDYFLSFPGHDKLTYTLVNLKEGLPDEPPVLYPLELTDGKRVIADGMFDYDALIFDGAQFDHVGIANPDGSPFVTMTCPDFPSFGIWSMEDAPFVCLEPWDGRCDNVGFASEIKEKQDIVALPAGETYRKYYILTIH